VYDTNTSTAKGECMHSEEEYNQAMLERQQMLEEALERAETGVATEDDWNTIYFECRATRRPKLTETRSE
jgi:hypothetical protein